MIYTSGSTGHPKGVVVAHASVANHMLWMADEHALDQKDVVINRTAISFDAAVWEVWLPLVTGAQVCLAPGTSSLEEFIIRNGITTVQFVPTLLRAVVHAATSSAGKLRRVYSGGEPLSAALARDTMRAWNASVINLYGPTEATIQITSHCVSEKDIKIGNHSDWPTDLECSGLCIG